MTAVTVTRARIAVTATIAEDQAAIGTQCARMPVVDVAASAAKMQMLHQQVHHQNARHKRHWLPKERSLGGSTSLAKVGSFAFQQTVICPNRQIRLYRPHSFDSSRSVVAIRSKRHMVVITAAAASSPTSRH